MLKQQVPILSWLLFVLAVSLYGCSAGSGEGLDQSGQPISDLPIDEPNDDQNDNNQGDPSSVTLADLQEQVLTPICSQCHLGNNAPLGLNMDSLSNSENNLINVASATNSNFMRVKPGEPENSFLYLKITGDARAGNRMPLGQAPLSDDIIADFRSWIAAGAAVSAERVNLIAVEMQKQQDKTAFVLKFNQPITTSSLQAEQIDWFSKVEGQRERYFPDSVELNWQSNNQVEIVVSSPAGADPSINFQINQPNVASVYSQQGVMLDGNSNGEPGGVFQYEMAK